LKLRFAAGPDMDSKTNKDQQIMDFLLGALPPAESEALDELSFTDDDFAARLQAAEKDLVDAYAQGGLAGAELQRFNSCDLASPSRRRQVEFALALQTYAGRETAPAPRQPALENKSRWAGFDFFAGSWRQWGLAAAALALTLAGVWFVWNQTRPRHETEQAVNQPTPAPTPQPAPTADNTAPTPAPTFRESPRPPAPTPLAKPTPAPPVKETPPAPPVKETPPAPPPRSGVIVALNLAAPTRSPVAPPALALPSDAETVAARLQLEASDAKAYRVALREAASGRVIWRSNRLKASGATLPVNVPARLLRAQIYQLEVTAGAEIIGGYTFQVLRK
jgi:hypothetical protein